MVDRSPLLICPYEAEGRVEEGELLRMGVNA